jgi:hypothetical protein
MCVGAGDPDLLLGECDDRLVIQDNGPVSVELSSLEEHGIARSERSLDWDQLPKFMDHGRSGPKFNF